MTIYDIYGNPIVSPSSGNGEIPDNSITPAKTTFFDEQPIYKLIDCGEMIEGVIYSDGSFGGGTGYVSTADYVPIKEADKIYFVCNSEGLPRVICYDENKAYIAEGTKTTSYKNMSDGTVCAYGEIAIPEGTKYIKASFKAASEHYLSYNAIPVPYDIDQTDFTCREGYAERIWEAMGIPSLEAIGRFRGKTMIVGGDSIVENNQTTENNPWASQLAEILGMTIYNDGHGGTGFAKNYVDNNSTIVQIEKWADVYTANPDVILIMGNMNDGTGGSFSYTYPDDYDGNGTPPPVGTPDDDSTVFSQYGIVRRLLERLIALYPTTKIGIISSTPRDLDVRYWPDKPKSYGHGWYEDYLDAMKYVCEDMNIPFLDLYHNNVLRPWNISNVAKFYWDGSEETLAEKGYTGAVHPNAQGHLEGILRPVLWWMCQWM